MLIKSLRSVQSFEHQYYINLSTLTLRDKEDTQIDKTLEWLERFVGERNAELVAISLEMKIGGERGAMGKGATDPRMSKLRRSAGLMS